MQSLKIEGKGIIPLTLIKQELIKPRSILQFILSSL